MHQIAVIAGHRGSGSGAHGVFDEAAETIALRDLVVLELSMRGVAPITDCSDSASLSEVFDHLRRQLSQYDICIDIHFNAVSDPRASGSEVIVPNDYSADEWHIAEKILTGLCAIMHTRNRGIKREGSINRSLRMLQLPCRTMILEVCFCTNQADANAYFANRAAIAQHIADVLIRYARSDKY